jgi:hypothetical protein
MLAAALLSTSRKWPREGALLFVLTTSGLSLEHIENIHGFDL